MTLYRVRLTQDVLVQATSPKQAEILVLEYALESTTGDGRSMRPYRPRPMDNARVGRARAAHFEEA